METASMSSREVDLAEKEARRAKEGSTRLEAEVKRLSTQVADLNTSHKYVKRWTDVCALDLKPHWYLSRIRAALQTSQIKGDMQEQHGVKGARTSAVSYT